MGGIYNSLFTIGFLFCAAFSYNLFLSSLIRKLYHFRARFDSELAKDKSKKKSKNILKRRKSSEYGGDGDATGAYLDTNNSGSGGNGNSQDV